ncbi:MAG: chemotaxis protein CheA [Chloroflexi bacterium]|nr:MAG: chemotaxis protein CheA [Chloroflexota bacterium]MBL1194855.1 chemotaxis protein CheA [Chloroflexota bacterium]NOH12146.1 chemotaxis protein CheA [Chloroflexota bacterium]
MTLEIDLSEEEVSIYIAESDEQLETLAQGFVRLEQEQDNEDLVQSLFRAAHTLKGSAGMIGHTRMVDITHTLEAALDQVRKGKLIPNPELIDMCLDAVDAITILRDEVISQEESGIEIGELVSYFKGLIEDLTASDATPETVSSSENGTKKEELATASTNGSSGGMPVFARISEKSVSPAARALQLYMALAGLGEITSMSPSKEDIESGVKAYEFSAELITSASNEEVGETLKAISEIDELRINQQATSTLPDQIKPQTETANNNIPERLGDVLVSGGFITDAHLKYALKTQSLQEEKQALGQVLVDMQALSQEELDEAIQQHVQQQKLSLKELKAKQKSNGKQAEKTIRTSVERLDKLMTLVGELITDRNRLFQLREELESSYYQNEEFVHLFESITHIGRVTSELQTEVLNIRMLPVANVFNKFPRMVRDMARKANKEINFVVKGEHTEVDRSILDELNDPLIHLLRNSVDHGIEAAEKREAAGKPAKGEIVLEAQHLHGQIVITVIDDGGGIDTERVKAKAVSRGMITASEAETMSHQEALLLIFHSGLSTKDKASAISGRGVGMDIVRQNIEAINGSIGIESSPESGTRFEITLPLTLAIMPTLLVKLCDSTLGLPLANVNETLRIEKAEIRSVRGREVVQIREQILPLIRLGQVLNYQEQSNKFDYESVVAVHFGKLRVGIVIDAFMREEDLMVNPLGALAKNTQGFSGTSILGNGEVAMILDLSSLLKLANLN